MRWDKFARIMLARVVSREENTVEKEAMLQKIKELGQTISDMTGGKVAFVLIAMPANIRSPETFYTANVNNMNALGMLNNALSGIFREMTNN